MQKILLDQAMELTQAQGECWIVLKDGSIKTVNIGDILPKGVLLVSPSDVELTPPAMESVENHSPNETIASDEGEIAPAVEQELAAIQQAIQDGQDPTEIAQATASGGATAGGIAGSGNAGSIVTERTAKATISEAGFDTAHNSRDPQRQDALPGDEIAGKIEHPPMAFDQQQIISEDTPTLFAQVPAALDLDSDGINPQGYALVSGVQNGQLTLNADGSYQYVPSPEFQSLKEGETRQVFFTYIATDPSGNQSAPATVIITITGTNDIATISVATPGADQGAVKEDVTLTTGGKLVATDIDNGEAVFQPQTQVKGAHGTFSIDKEGNWTYELDNTDPLVQALKEGESLPSETFVVHSADGSAQHTVTVAITGTNDDATISVATPGADQGAVKEDVTLTTGGKLVATDIDNGEAVFQPQTQVNGAHGTFTIDKEGNWTYQLNNNDPLVQALKEGESLPSETFVVHSADGSAQHTVTVAITGTNDDATISVATPGADQGAVKEDVTLTTGGKLVATDIDNGEAVFQPQTQVNGAHGTFTIDKEGNWTYQLNNNDPLVQALKEGESLPSETFVVHSADGSAQHTVTVAITGTNDTATISVATPGADQGAVKEDVTLTTGGKLVATDIDNGEAVFQPQTQVNGAHGTFTIDKEGNWTYQLNNNDPLVQALKEGESLPSETFVVHSADGSAQHTVTVAITGTNDTATISVATPGADQGAVKEDVTLTTGGKLVATDIDNGEAVFQPQTQVKGAHGTFSIDKEGNWTYELDNTDPLVQALKEGESLPSETFVVHSADGSAQHTVTVAITGTNDDATISVATPGADQGAVKEDVTLTTGGKLVATDIDNGEAVFQPQTQVNGAHGTFTIDKEGNWTYQLNNNDPLVQALKEGESLPSETFVVHSADGSAQHTVTVAITGTNDDATISVATPGADQGAVKEDVTLTTGGKLVATDIDNGEAVFQPQTQVNGAHGTFTIDKEGNWTYQLNNNDPLVQALKEGESLPSETFVVHSADGSAQHTVTVAITGTNDTATISVATPGADQGAVKEDVTLTTGGKLVATDIDNGEAVFQPQTQVKGAHGTFSIDKEGNWTYQLNNNDPLVQALKEGESLPSETFVVHSADGSAQHTVTVAITGTNDDATISVATPGADQGAVKEDVTLTTGGKLVATDIDNGEAVFQPQTLVKGAHGTFSIDTDGNWTYQLNNKDPLVQALKEGESLPSETFVVHSADGSAQHTVTVAITGTNEDPDAQDDGLASNKIVTLDGQNWDTSGDIEVNYYVINATTGLKVADAEKSDYTGDGDHRFGVKSGIEQPSADTVQAGQIGYLDSADQSEAMSFTFQQGQVANHATIQVKNLWSDIAHGSWEPGIERGVWKAFYKGELVATGIFEGTSGGRQDVQIDAGGRYFDTIEMSAIGYKDGIVDPKGSEYFITQVTADLTRFDQAYQTNETGVLSLDVLSNDSDPNGDAIAIVPGSYPAYITLVNGKLQFDAAKYLLTLPEAERDLAAGEAKEIKFDYVIRDTHGATDHASVTITLIGETQPAPAPLHVTVQEDGLTGGAHAHSEGPLPGAHDTTPHDYQFATRQTGTAVSSGGKPLSYEVSSDGLTLTGFIMEDGHKTNVLTAQLNSQSGTYQLDLFRPLDHSAAGKDTLSLPFELDIKVGNQHTKGELVIDVIDSTPAPAHLTLTTGDMAPQSNSVIIALDMSGSMGEAVKDADGNTTTRWALSQQAIKAMFEQYDKLGDVQFKIATHAGQPDGQVSGWLHSLADIQQFFSKLSPAAWTPYTQALNQLDAILADSQNQQDMAGSNKQFYFLSDGAPSDFDYWLNGRDKSDMFRERLMKGISPDEVGGEQHYQDLLNGRVAPTKAEQLLILGESMEHILAQHGHPFDNVNMLAIGQSSSLEYLEPMAGQDGAAIKVEKDADIISTLTESVPGQLHGDVTGSSIEGEWVENLAHDGRTYFYDQKQNGIFAHNSDSDSKVVDGSKLTLDTTNGKLVLNFETGQYDYQAKDVHGDGQDKFLLTLRDGDGDTADTSLVIKVTDLQGGISASPLTLGSDEKSASSAHSAPLLGTEAQDELIELPVSQPAAPANHVESLTTTGIAIGDLLGHDEMGNLLTQVAPATQDSAGISAEGLTTSVLPDGNASDLLSHTMPNQVFDELLSQQQFIQ